MTAQRLPARQESILDPAIQDLITLFDSHGAPPVQTLTPEEARSGLLRIQPAFRTNNIARTLTLENHGRVIPLHVIRPQSAPSVLPQW